MNQNPNRILKPRSLFTLLLILLLLLPSVSVPPNARAAALKSLAFSSSKSELGEGQSVTLLADGRQLLIGGQDSPAGVFIRDPRTGELTPVSGGLHFPRAWHTATVLPDGRVMILGGVGSGGQIVESAEIVDPESKTLSLLSGLNAPDAHSPIEARAFHTATLLTDGRVLIAGGVSKDGKILDDAEVWDPRSGAIEKPPSGLSIARYGHTATLLSDGNVIVSGGFDRDSAQLKAYELFDAEGQSFTALDTFSEKAENTQPHLAASLPEDDEDNVKADSVIALRFPNRCASRQ